MPYVIAEETFKTKDGIKDRCRFIVETTPNGQTVDVAHLGFLLDLFSYHDNWQEKSGNGIRRITTQPAPQGTRCFAIERCDGSSIDISWNTPLRLLPSSRTPALLPQALKDFRGACRTAVEPQIWQFRDSALLTINVCTLTGNELNRTNCAVDHTPPQTFDRILYEFCVERGINPLNIAVDSENGTVPILLDHSLLQDWQTHHKIHAQLQLVSRIGNLQNKKESIAWMDICHH